MNVTTNDIIKETEDFPVRIPALDDFLNNTYKRPFDVCFWCPIMKFLTNCDLFFTNIGDYFKRRSAEKYIKALANTQKENERLRIQTIVRSIRPSFLKFNYGCTYYDQNSKGEYTRTRHNLVKDRNITRHFKIV